MSLLLLIDGYNIIGPVAPPSRNSHVRWLERERALLIRRLADHLDEKVRRKTCVVFDAANPPPDRPSRFQVQGIDVQYAVGYPEADDLLEELIARQSAPKRLAVVSSDQRIQTAARRRGSVAFDSQPWLDDLLDGVVRLAVERRSGAGQGSGRRENEKPEQEKPEQTVDDDDIENWMREFGL